MIEPFTWIHEVPDRALSHLLMPRNPYEVETKDYLQALEDTIGNFHSIPGEGL